MFNKKLSLVISCITSRSRNKHENDGDLTVGSEQQADRIAARPIVYPIRRTIL